MRQMLRLIALLLLATLVLTACGGDNSAESGSDQPTRTARRAPTEEEDEEPTATRRARPSPTSEEEDEDEPLTPGELKTISSLEGDFSIGCPDNWKVDVDTRSLECLHPDEEVVIQIRTNELAESEQNKKLAEDTNEELRNAFGENYVAEDDNMEEQGDGSYRIDFDVTANEEHGTPEMVGRAFVEEHDKIYFLFMILIDASKVEDYSDIVEEIIDSYTIETDS
jgi:hypothetical protein